jgi:hypothetical protein
LLAGSLSAEGGDLQIRIVDSDGSAAVAGSSTSKGFTVQVSDGAGNGVSDAAVVMRLPDGVVTGAFADGTHAAVAYTDERGQAHWAGVQWSTVPGVVGVRITATKGTIHAGILFEETLRGGITPAAEAAPVAVAVEPNPVVVAPRPLISVRQPGSVAAANAEAFDRLPNLRPANAGSPGVSVTNGPTGAKIHGGGGKTKWIILAVAVAAGAGVAVAMAAKGKSSSSSTTAGGVSIGAPTVSVGAP